MEGIEGYQMLFTGSKNIAPSLAYLDFKFGFYMYNYIAVACFNRNYLEILVTDNQQVPEVLAGSWSHAE